MPVDARSPDAAKWLPIWTMLRDFAEGEAKVKAGAGTYLPYLSAMANDEEKLVYAGYLERALFYGAYGRTIDGLSGMAFRKPPDVEAPPALEDFLTDVTGAGEPFDGFAEDCVDELLTTGRGGILVDHPDVEERDGTGRIVPLTAARARALDLRPYWVLYRTEDILDYRVERRGGRARLVHWLNGRGEIVTLAG